MGWKNLSYTKKGMIIGLILVGLFIILNFIQIPSCEYCRQHELKGQLIYNCDTWLRILSCFPASINLFFAWAGCGVESATDSCIYRSFTFLILFESFILWSISTLIGWIVGKVKKK